MITIRAAQLVPILNALGDLGDNRLPLLTAVRVKRLTKELGEYQEAFAGDVRPFLEEFGDPERGTVPSENLEAFVEAAEEVLNTEITLDQDPIQMSHLEEIAEGRDLDIRPESLAFLEAVGLLT